jgi:hypothetical protein
LSTERFHAGLQAKLARFHDELIGVASRFLRLQPMKLAPDRTCSQSSEAFPVQSESTIFPEEKSVNQNRQRKLCISVDGCAKSRAIEIAFQREGKPTVLEKHLGKWTKT